MAAATTRFTVMDGLRSLERPRGPANPLAKRHLGHGSSLRTRSAPAFWTTPNIPVRGPHHTPLEAKRHPFGMISQALTGFSLSRRPRTAFDFDFILRRVGV